MGTYIYLFIDIHDRLDKVIRAWASEAVLIIRVLYSCFHSHTSVIRLYLYGNTASSGPFRQLILYQNPRNTLTISGVKVKATVQNSYYSLITSNMRGILTSIVVGTMVFLMKFILNQDSLNDFLWYSLLECYACVLKINYFKVCSFIN